MRRITLAQALLWLVNAAIAARILFLVFLETRPLPPPLPGPPVREPERALRQFDSSYVRNLPNPVRVCGLPEERFVYLGGYSIADRPGSEVAFLYLPRRGVHVNAYPDEPIPGSALTLKGLTSRGALFTDGARDIELPLAGAPR